MVDVSIVVPVYNTEKFLQNCIRSAVNQSLQNIEIICVDDCSKDNSLGILENFAAEDRRVKILKNERQLKTFSTRAKGFMAATGKYVLCLDSDDELMPEVAEKMFNLAESKQADIVHFRIHECTEDGILIRERKFHKNPRHKHQILGKAIAEGVIKDTICHTIGGKFVKTEVVQKAIIELEMVSGVLNKSILTNEDFLFMLAIGLFSQKYIPTNEIGYKYIQHPVSVMNTARSCDERMMRNLRDICEIADAYDKLLASMCNEDLQKLFRKHIQWRAMSLSKRPNEFANQIKAAHMVAETSIFNNKTLAKVIFKMQLRNLSKFFNKEIIDLYKTLLSRVFKRQVA